MYFPWGFLVYLQDHKPKPQTQTTNPNHKPKPQTQTTNPVQTNPQASKFGPRQRCCLLLAGRTARIGGAADGAGGAATAAPGAGCAGPRGGGQCGGGRRAPGPALQGCLGLFLRLRRKKLFVRLSSLCFFFGCLEGKEGSRHFFWRLSFFLYLNIVDWVFETKIHGPTHPNTHARTDL